MADTRTDKWFEAACEWVDRHPGSCCAVSRGSDEWQAWKAYFEGIGIRPWFLDNRQFTAPCRWPSNFDLPLTNVLKTSYEGSRDDLEGYGP